MDRLAPIVNLLKLRGPSAVVGLIVAVVVGIAVDRVFWRRPALHVGEEAQVGMYAVLSDEPSATDDDASTAVVLEVFPVRVLAATDHIAPGDVLRLLRAIARALTVNCPRLDGAFALKAATALRTSNAKLAGAHGDDGPAIALAGPSRLQLCAAAQFWCQLFHQEPAEARADEVHERRHYFLHRALSVSTMAAPLMV